MANRKISDLTALTAPVTGDLLPIVDISEAAAADKNKKITYGTFLSSVPLGTAAAPSVAFLGDTNTGIYSPGADQLAISTGGTGRIIVDASGNVNIDSNTLYVDAVNNRVGIVTTSPVGALDVAVGGAGPARIIFSQVSDNPYIDIYKATGSGSNFAGFKLSTPSTTGELVFSNATGAAIGSHSFTERMRIDSSGRLLVGTSTSADLGSTIQTAQTGGTGAFEAFQYSNSTAYPFITFAKSRGASVGTNVIVSSGDTLGELIFRGANGTTFNSAASITALVDGTPGASNDMPGRLVFSTTADGAASPTEALRITNDRVIAYNQPTPATYAAAATLTVADLKTKIITYTGTAATLTLPTGTLTEGGFSGIYTNMAFEWSVINTGAGICTIGAGTAHTIVGSATVAIGASARFASRRTAANTFVSYRLS